MLLCLLLLESALSIKPIYLISGFGDSPIFSKIHNPLLYPECPSNMSRIIIKSKKDFNKDFLSLYPDCVAKLLRVQFNKSNGKVDQLPGIYTNSTLIGDPSIFNYTFGSIIKKINQVGYQNNINFFSVGYNYFLHPVSSYSVYDILKERIEQFYSQTREKAILISYEQGTSFTSIFLSNYSQSSWVKRYIDSVIFISPTFAGLPSLSTLITQNLAPFTSNDEFKKTIMRMPGLHINLPNYFIYENHTIESKFNASLSFEFLKDLRKVDDESEAIFKAEVEKYLKVPVPEPPIPSMIIYAGKTAKTVKKGQISLTSNSSTDSEGPYYACSRWRKAKCYEITFKNDEIIKSNEVSKKVIEFVNNRNHIKFKKKIQLMNDRPISKEVQTVTYTNCSGQFNDDQYISSHMVDPEDFEYSGPAGYSNFVLSNAFDWNMRTYYLCEEINDDKFNATFTINFSKTVDLDAFLYDPAYVSRQNDRTFNGCPLLVAVYVSTGDQPFTLNTIFRSDPVFPWTRFQFVFPEKVTCDRLKLEFAEVTLQEMAMLPGETNPTANLVICNLLFIQHLDESPSSIWSATGIYNNNEYVKKHMVDFSKISYNLPQNDQGLQNYPLSNAFDNNPSSYYIPSSSFQNIIEVVFDTTVSLDAFLYDLAFVDEPNRVFHGFPKIVNVYAASGSDSYQLITFFYGTSVHWLTRVQFVFPQVVTCDKLKIEFIRVQKQTIEGSSNTPVIGGIYFMLHSESIPFTEIEGNYSHEGYFKTHLVDSSLLTFTGTKANSNPISNAFDDDPNTQYISEIANNWTFNSQITVNFTEKVTVDCILMDISRNINEKSVNGCPKKIIISSSIGENDFSFVALYNGEPVYTMSRIQFKFPQPIDCEKLKIEFIEVTEHFLLSNEGTKSPVVVDLYFIESLQSFIFSQASESYKNDTFVKEVMVDQLAFTYKGAEGIADHQLSFAFDSNPDTFYISSVPNNDSFVNSLLINFNEKVILDAFLYDSHFDGTLFHGFPTGLTVHASLGDVTEKFIFFGTPVSPWKRIQFVFPQFVECDSLLIEFVSLTNQSIVDNSKSPVIDDLYFVKAQIPATPVETPSETPKETPSETPLETPSISPSASSFISPSISPSCSSSLSPSLSPSSTPVYDPTILPIEDVCAPGKSCNFEGSADNQILVTINSSDFSNIENNNDGGAIIIKNAGLICDNISFSSCQSNSGGGGGIYIRNDIENLRNEIRLSNVSLSNCRAMYGGAIYIYSISEEDEIEIIGCSFMNNQADASSNNDSASLNGGSAIFITSKKSTIVECNFLRNRGECQLKIYNSFESGAKKTASFFHGRKRSVNVIKYCRFVISRETKSSLFYLAGYNGALCTIRNSVFVGELNVGCYHMSGQSISNKSPKLVVEFCKFSTDHSKSFKENSVNYLAVIVSKQIFNYNESKDFERKNVFEIVLAAIGVAFVVGLIFLFEKKSKRHDDNESNSILDTLL